MLDRLDAMRMVVRVVDRGGFSAASRDLGVPLATISRRVAELETHLGSRLLLRSTRKLALTEAGAAYVAAARRILEAVEAAEQAAAGEFQAPRGELVVAAPVLFGALHVLPVINAFLAAYPQITVRLTLSDRNVQLIDDHVDMAVRIGTLPDSSLVASRIGSMRKVVCASPGWIAAHGTPASPADLGTRPCVHFDAMGSHASWRFAAGPDSKASEEVAVRARLTVSTAAAAVAAAEQGVGATQVLHYQCADAVAAGRLMLILCGHETPALPVHLLHPDASMIPTKLRAFLDYASPRLRARLAALV